jgi:hypothetical protein
MIALEFLFTSLGSSVSSHVRALTFSAGVNFFGLYHSSSYGSSVKYTTVPSIGVGLVGVYFPGECCCHCVCEPNKRSAYRLAMVREEAQEAPQNKKASVRGSFVRHEGDYFRVFFLALPTKTKPSLGPGMAPRT